MLLPVIKFYFQYEYKYHLRMQFIDVNCVESILIYT